MHDADDGGVAFVRQIDNGTEYRPYIGGAEAVNLPYTEISGHRIDLDQQDASDLHNFLLQHLQVGDEAEHSVFAAFANHVDEMDALEISARGDEARRPWPITLVSSGRP
jgi:hypothetical protein